MHHKSNENNLVFLFLLLIMRIIIIKNHKCDDLFIYY
jgi:hypothetical protein